MIKNIAVTTKVSLKTNLSTPLLVKDDELELLENPVPRTWSNTKIMSKKALMD